MTPEAKAREIADVWFDKLVGEGGLYHSRAELAEHLLHALRDVERETLERAAKKVERLAFESQSVNEALPEIAHSIRSLLQKEGG